MIDATSEKITIDDCVAIDPGTVIRASEDVEEYMVVEWIPAKIIKKIKEFPEYKNIKPKERK